MYFYLASILELLRYVKNLAVTMETNQLQQDGARRSNKEFLHERDFLHVPFPASFQT